MSERRKAYPFDEIEARWQARWDDEKSFRTPNPGDADFDGSKPKFYVLDMYPYPSGAGLHVGHPEGYTATDIVARYKRKTGSNVLHPMGWDAFGLPAEQHAIKTGEHPRINTENNVNNFRRQLKRIGFSYDWDREINTTDPGYVKWTQWIFLQLYNSYFDEETQRARPVSELEAKGLTREEIDDKRLAYVADVAVNWSPDLGTVLANEEVEEWQSKGHTVERRPLRQWMLRITAYAERLQNELDGLDWPEGIKLLQKNWIGRSEGASVRFQVSGSDDDIEVFTTRPDTLFGATYMVLAPEHALVDQVTTPEQGEAVKAYRNACASKSDLERTELAKEKTGVFTGGFAVNPVNGEEIPIWIADYVLLSYGTGAIMAVPGHDERDHEFAGKFGLPIVEVVKPEGGMGFQPMGPVEDVKRRKGAALPHWTQEGATYTVVFRLDDALPQEVAEAWKSEREDIVRTARELGRNISPQEAARLRELYSEKIEAKLDAGYGECWLKDDRIAELIENALKHFSGDRYELDAWCVMPNHVHAIVRPAKGFELSDIVHSWKSFTANKANEILGRSGKFWQPEPYDHLVRDREDYVNQVRYVLENPEKAGLKDWKWVGCKDGVLDQNHRQDADATCFTGDGVAVNSPLIDGLETPEAKKKITTWLEVKDLGEGAVNYKLRDWLFSRQRYWGEPFPVVWVDGKHEGVPESELPVIAPEMEDYKPTGNPEPLLSKATEWVKYSENAKRETNTMPQWAGSCWYYLRFCDTENDERLVSEEAERYWMDSGKPGGVDLYIGGTEHAVLHLLYARFWHKVLNDLGYVSTPEPFQRLVNQGLILGEDGQKMSKSRGNVVNPDDVIDEFGADSFRLFEMFMGPLEQVKPWSTKGVEGVHRFLARVWRLFMELDQEGNWALSEKITEIEPTKTQLRVLHETIKKVTGDIETLGFNTAIAQMMVCVNELTQAEERPVQALVTLLQLLNPFAPHISEELNETLRGKFPDLPGGLLAHQPWPEYDEKNLVQDEIEMVIQVNGKVRDRMTVSVDASKEELESAAQEREKVKQFTEGKTVRKVIVVPKKLINIVAN